MPSPPSLTGFPNDPQRNLPNPQSYDTSAADVVIDNVTHLVWQKAASTETLSWADAQALCANLDLGGRSDWRLPARVELDSLVDVTAWQSGCIDDNAFPDPPEKAFWSCTSGPANPLVAWFVDFSNGGEALDTKSVANYHVRCVAGMSAVTAPPERYDLTTPGEVHDLKTILNWATAVSDPVNWGQAFDYCGGLGPGWRLPSMTELETLIDETQAGTAVVHAAFPNTPGDFYWTSSAYQSRSDSFWFVSIGIGNTYWLPTSEIHLARCVR